MTAQVDPHSPPRFRVNGSIANLPNLLRLRVCAGDCDEPAVKWRGVVRGGLRRGSCVHKGGVRRAVP